MQPSLQYVRDLEEENGRLLVERPLTIGHEERGFFGDEILEDHANELLEKARTAQPSLLFSLSHGLGAPLGDAWSAEDQRATQGAMKLGGKQAKRHLSARELREREFLPGGLWLFFACFGAGSPRRSAYHDWLAELSKLGLHRRPLEGVLRTLPPQPFVAALPQAALRNQDGPLGVIGHVDLAWTWSFLDSVTRLDRRRPEGRHERFQGILRAVLEGGRFGAAHNEITCHFSSEGRRLLQMYDSDKKAGAEAPNDAATRVRQAKRADLWMQCHDLSAWVLLGDPAARLPIRTKPRDLESPTAAERSGGSVIASAHGPRSGATAGADPEPAVNEAENRDVKDMERAVIACLRGRDSREAIAQRFGVTQDVLDEWEETYREGGRRALAGSGGARKGGASQ